MKLIYWPRSITVNLGRIRRSLISRSFTYKCKVWAIIKKYTRVFKNKGEPNAYIFIMGCQRSGTTLLERIFRDDLKSSVYGEFSDLSIYKDRTVWKQLPEIDSIFSMCNSAYTVAKPLFESDRAHEFLDYFHQLTVVWVFRDPVRVVNSMVNKWQDNFFDISRSVESNNDGVWRLEGLYKSIKKESILLTGRDDRSEDLYALFWCRRNQYVFDKGLSLHKHVIFLNYTSLVKEPRYTIDRIMKRAGMNGVWKFFSTDANAEMENKYIKSNISTPIKIKCNAIYKNLLVLDRQEFNSHIRK